MGKVGIIVPFRDRWEHYKLFKKSIVRYLDKNNYDYSLIIVEQDNANAFNRGMLCNIGFLEAKKQNCTHVVFHDIDMLPIDIDYSYSEFPLHLLTQDLPFDSYFGGITLFPTEVFEKINGFSNLYWGWGFEDDDLRYRCIDKNINLNPIEEKYKPTLIRTSAYNGFDSYSTLENNINIVRDFKIEIKLRLGELIFDHTKQYDDFIIFNIQGCDFKLKYTSFKRFYLEVFDKKNKMYTLNSKVSDLRNFAIKIQYTARTRSLKFFINEELVEEKVLEAPMFNYNKVKEINIGSDNNLENKFKGLIDSFTIFNKYDEDITLPIKEVNVDNDVHPSFNHFNYSFIPYRRESKVKKLTHEDSGFKNGVWKNNLTRWNQLRFNNEVLLSTNEQKYEGLSNCNFKLHNRLGSSNFIHLKVGI